MFIEFNLPPTTARSGSTLRDTFPLAYNAETTQVTVSSPQGGGLSSGVLRQNQATISAKQIGTPASWPKASPNFVSIP